MSAIGNYIYYGWQNYYDGTSKKEGVKESEQFVSVPYARQAIKALKNQQQIITAEANQYNDTKTAQLIEATLNKFVEPNIITKKNPDGDVTQKELSRYKRTVLKHLQGIKAKNFTDATGIDWNTLTPIRAKISPELRDILNVLKGNSKDIEDLMKSKQDLIEQLTKLANAGIKGKLNIINILDQSMINDNIDLKGTVRIGIIAKTLNTIAKNSVQGFNAFYNKLSKEEQEAIDEATTDARISNLKEALKTFSEEDYQAGLHKTKKVKGSVANKGSGLLSDIVTTINVLQYPPQSLTGIITEAAFAAGLSMIPLNKIKGKVVGDNAPSRILQSDKKNMTNVFYYAEDFQKDLVKDGYTLNTTFNKGDIKASIVIPAKKQKVDVSMQYKIGNNIVSTGASVKHSSHNSYISGLKDGVMFNLVAANNQMNFLNHYINIMSPHYYNKDKAELFDRSQLHNMLSHRKDFSKVMHQLLVMRAYFGGNGQNLAKGGKLVSSNAAFFATFRVINSDEKNTITDKSGYWVIMTAKEFYDKIVNQTTPRYTFTKDTINNEGIVQPWPYTNVSKMLGEPAAPGCTGAKPISGTPEAEQAIKKRLSIVLSHLHKKHISVYLQGKVMDDIYKQH